MSRSRAAGLLLGTLALLAGAVPLLLLRLALAAPPANTLAAGARAMVLVLAVAAWLSCSAAILRATLAQLRGRTVGRGPIERVAARLVIALTMILPGLGVATASAAPAPTAVPVTTSTPAPHGKLPAPVLAPSERTWTVAPGDCLWTIAARVLGDPRRWVEIWDLNAGREIGGVLFENPSLLLVGWRLLLPITTPTAPPLAAAAPRAAHQSAARAPQASVPASAGTPRPRHSAVSSIEPASIGAVRSDDVDEVVLGSLGALGLALLGRQLRRRHRTPLRPQFDDATASMVRLATEVTDSGLVEAIESLLERCDELESAATTLLFASAGTPLVSTSPLDGLVALPLIGPEGAPRVAALAPGSTLELRGPGAADLAKLYREVATAWSWGSTVTVVDRPAAAATATSLVDPHAGERQGVLYLGQRADLAPDVAARCAVLEVDECDGPLEARLDGAVISSTEAQRLPEPQRAALELLLADEPSTELIESRDDGTALATSPLPPDGRPGTAMVRLLVAMPRLEGLAEELDPRRARRATELAAYLALARPTPVHGDRLRSRVLGTAEHDAAAKTLANTISALRRALGPSATGAPLLPLGARSGTYTLDSLVRCDVTELLAWCEAAHSTEDPAYCIAAARAAAELVEAPPLDTAYVGYAWFDFEGWRQRIAARLTEAVSRAVPLALERGHVELAELLIERASWCAPFEETLAQLALEVAATRGVGALRFAYERQQVACEAFEPGFGPSPATEARYAELRAALEIAGTAQASLAAIEAAPRSTSPSAPAAL